MRSCLKYKANETLWWKIVDGGFLCNRCYKADWYQKHRGPIKRIPMTPEQLEIKKKEWAKKSYENSKDKRKTYFDGRKDLKKEYDRVYREKNRDRLRAQYKHRLETNIQAKLSYKLRCRIKDAMRDYARGKRKAGSAVRDLGCTTAQLLIHLESKFQPGMTWENWGINGWHIDHIKPLALFDLTIKEDFLAAANYKNLQPLWAKDNLSKNKKYE